MPVFEIQKGGKTFEIDAPNQDAAIKALGSMDMQSVSSAQSQGDMGGAAILGATGAAGLGGRAIQALATSPTLPKTAATIGRVIGGVMAPVGGAMAGGAAGGPVGAIGGGLVGATQAAKGAWQGGRTGWFTGKLAQQLMQPVAKVADAVAPYVAEAGGLLGVVQGALDLHQMAEPNRKDIGTFGMTMSGVRTDAEKQANPALLNQVFDALADKWHSFMGDYPKELGKSSWNALNPTQRLAAFHTFMQKQTGGG